ncbi:MAG: response regulator transcription factor [Oscillospiraceae bacterium]|nr:response regulator transcription factor [Oscillospiraceae bacterium]
MFHILVVEDDPHTRKLMCTVLERAGYIPHPAEDGVDALEVMDHQHVDLAVVDLMMPRMDGYEFTRTLRDGSCQLPVLMVTAKVSRSDMRQGFEAGTDDYLCKPVDEEEMLWRIAALLRRAQSTSSRVLTAGSTRLQYDAFSVSRDGETQILPPKEFLLLFKLLSSPGMMFTKRQLMDEIWDMDSNADEHTVEVHIGRLRDRFRDCSDFEIRTIRGFGYMGLLPEDSNAEI